MFYVLDKDNKPKRVSPSRWAFTFEHGNRRVAEETVGGVRISTVFLGLDHNFSRKGPPLLFETMAFDDDGPFPLLCCRYSTWDEAVTGHRSIVAACTELAEATVGRLKEVLHL